MQIIKFTDINVDGYGTDVEVYVQVEGRKELTNGIVERMKEEIKKYKIENYGEWDTDSVVEVACEYLETEGYMCHSVIPDYNVEF